MKILFFIVVVSTGMLSACQRTTDVNALNRLLADPLPALNYDLTQVVISDVFTPPVISRIFAYSNVAAYEALRPAYPSMKSYAGRLHGLKSLPGPAARKTCDFRVASIFAFTTVAAKLVYNGQAITDVENGFLHRLDSLNIDPAVRDSSISFGRLVGNHVLAWAKNDGYQQRNSLPAYTVTRESGRWQPTPPNYTDAIETNWRTLRPMVLDSCSQFRPGPPIRFDSTKGSPCYQEAYEVYKTVRQLSPQDSAIAYYWDDNPNVSVTDGHVTYFQQKNSPGGHWIHIACSVAEKEHYNDIKTAELISRTAIAAYDGFIACWDAKFTFKYFRPETFIYRYIDKDWSPILQTPPFPEYSSGHSMVSSSAAAVLTRMVGDNYAFTDSTEVPYGQPARRFSSFNAAANEATRSRLCGGIHFPYALKTGQEGGRKVGNFIMDKLQ